MITLKSLSFDKLLLSQKLTAFLCLIFAIGMIMSSILINSMVNQTAQQEISSKATMLMETMNSVRDYTSKHIKPQLADRLAQDFLPESVPAYSARTIFDKLRKNPQYQEFLYREATLNPTNLQDKANIFEAEVVKNFRNNSQLKEQTGFINNPDQAKGNIFYIAHPLAVSNQSCLECHSTPQIAPKSMIAKYGDKNGFNWHLHEIIGAQIIFVPAQKILSNAQQLFLSIILMTLVIFGATIIMIHRWLQKQVVKPITKISHTVEAISMGDLSKKLESKRQDEIGLLSQSIDRLGISLQMAMKRIQK
jgi:methyl-accepting chemotaxis protein